MTDPNRAGVGPTEQHQLSTPDVTPAQLLGVLSALVGLYVSQGVIDGRTAQIITGTASIVLPLVWVIADAVIRHGRSRALSLPPKGVVADDG